MRSIRSFLLLIGLFFSAIVPAQQFTEQYDVAAAAYQSGDFAKAEEIWTDLAEKGDSNAQYAMGIMHLKKEAQRSQDGAAFRYLVEAAKKQHVAAMFNLGVAYWEGRGVNRQPAKALNWWEVAAQRQDAGAQYNLGLAYYIGEGRAQDTDKAIYWVEQAADNGHPQAKSLLVTLKTQPTPVAVPVDSVQDSTSAQIAENSATGTTDKPTSNNQPTQAAPAKTGEAMATPATTAVSAPPKTPALVPNGSPIALTKNFTELRSAPSYQAVSLATIKPGTSLRVIKSGKQWSQVIIARSYPVWVYGTFLEDTGNGTGRIKGNNVNIRPRPSTDKQLSPALGQLNNGESVSIVLKRSPWIQIIPAQPLPAWVASKDIE